MKKNIALLAGGFSGEYEISVQSAETIAKHLNKKDFSLYTLFITKERWFYSNDKGEKIDLNKNNFSLPLGEETIHFDAVFFAIHGSPGEDGKMQGYLDMLGIPYTGCDLITSSLTFNKGYCNKVVAELQLVNIARSVHLLQHQPYKMKDILSALRLPVFVKPAEGGSSIGMSKVTKKEKLPEAIEKAFNVDAQILIEEFIEGRELSCGVFRTKDKIIPLPLTEIKSTKDFFDFEAKYSPGMAEEITPAEISSEESIQIQNTSKQLYQKLNCRGLVRFDFIREEPSKKLYFLEVNTMPGQSGGSIVPKQIRAAGWDPGTVYNMLIEDCFSSISQ